MNGGRKTCDKCGGTNVDCGRAESRLVKCFNVLSEKHQRAVIEMLQRAAAVGKSLTTEGIAIWDNRARETADALTSMGFGQVKRDFWTKVLRFVINDAGRAALAAHEAASRPSP